MGERCLISNTINSYEQLEPLRSAVNDVVRESWKIPQSYSDAGRWVRELVAYFIDENKDGLPSIVQLRPDLELRLDSCSLARPGQPDIIDQKAMQPLWFANSGLIVNALGHNLNR